jgi:hypothetical protein
MNSFQDRLSRCAMACQDEARDKYSQSNDEAGAQKVMYSCMSTCVDRHLALLKSVQGTIEREIDSVAKHL